MTMLEDWLPMGPGLGPPLPKFLGIYWPWAKPSLIGDLNDNGVVSQEDFDILRQYLMGIPISEISPLSEEEFIRRADINEDGVINVFDLVALGRILAGYAG